MNPVKRYKYPFPVRKKFTAERIQEIMDFYGDNRRSFGTRVLRSFETVKSWLVKGVQPSGGDNIILQQLEAEMLRDRAEVESIKKGNFHQNDSSKSKVLENLGQQRMFK